MLLFSFFLKMVIASLIGNICTQTTMGHPIKGLESHKGGSLPKYKHLDHYYTSPSQRIGYPVRIPTHKRKLTLVRNSNIHHATIIPSLVKESSPQPLSESELTPQ